MYSSFLLFFSCFFFYCYADHRVLHSFPTRRSSDLELKTWDDVKLLTVAVDRLTKWYRPGLLCIGDAAHAMRSEEHTSELQSRLHLVCRLLLEKKKKKKKYRHITTNNPEDSTARRNK